MNTRLIKKYKKEFDHWLDGGSIWLYRKQKWVYCISQDKELWKSKDNSLKIVIDDDLIEFRKALMEGKEVLYDIGTDTPLKISTQEELSNIFSETGHFNMQSLHIKDKKFNVGDWVTYPFTGGNEIVKESILRMNPNYYGNHKKWEPTRDEFVVSKMDIDDIYIVFKYKSSNLPNDSILPIIKKENLLPIDFLKTI